MFKLSKLYVLVIRISVIRYCLGFRAYPNNLVVMRPSEKSEDKAAGQKRPEA